MLERERLVEKEIQALVWALESMGSDLLRANTPCETLEK